MQRRMGKYMHGEFCIFDLLPAQMDTEYVFFMQALLNFHIPGMKVTGYKNEYKK